MAKKKITTKRKTTSKKKLKTPIKKTSTKKKLTSTTKNKSLTTIKKKFPPPSAYPLWLNNALSFIKKKDINGESYFESAINIITNIPGYAFLNLYITETGESHSPTILPSFFLLRIHQKNNAMNTAIANEGKEKFPLFIPKKEKLPFPWEEERLIEKNSNKNDFLRLYQYENETMHSSGVEEKTYVFYQPLWNRSNAIGAVSIVFEKKSSLSKASLPYLETAKLFLVNSLINERLYFYSEDVKKQESELRSSFIDLKKQFLKIKKETKNKENHLLSVIEKEKKEKDKEERGRKENQKALTSLEIEGIKLKDDLEKQKNKSVHLTSELSSAIENNQRLVTQEEKQRQEKEELSKKLSYFENAKNEIETLFQQKQQEFTQEKEELSKKLSYFENAKNEIETLFQQKQQEFTQEKEELSKKLSYFENAKNEIETLFQQKQQEFTQEKEELSKKLSYFENAKNEIETLFQQKQQEFTQEKEELSKKLSYFENAKNEIETLFQQKQQEYSYREEELKRELQKNQTELEKIKEEVVATLQNERQNMQEHFDEKHKEIYQNYKEKDKEAKEAKKQIVKTERRFEQVQSFSTKKEKDDKEKQEKLQKEISSLQNLFEQYKGKAKKTEEGLQDKIRKIKQEGIEESNFFQMEKAKQKEKLLQHEKEIPILKKQKTEGEYALKKEKEKTENLHEKEKSLQDQLDEKNKEIQAQITQNRKDKGERKFQLLDELRKQRQEYNEKIRIAVEDRKAKEAMQLEKHKIEKENDSLIEQRTISLQQLAEAESKYHNQEKELQTFNQEMANLREEQKKLKTAIRAQSNELNTSYEEKRAIEKTFHTHKDREIHLEKALFSVNKEVYFQKAHLDAEKEKRLEADEQILKKNQQIETLQKSLHSAHMKQKRWEQERMHAFQNEKEEKNKSQPLLPTILHSLSHGKNLEEKILLLDKGFLPEEQIERIFVYSLFEKERIQWEGGYWQKKSLFSDLPIIFSIGDSAFGEVFTNPYPKIITETDEIQNIDLPVIVKKYILAKHTDILEAEKKESLLPHTIAIFPLLTNGTVSGVLTLSSQKKQVFEKKTIIETISQITPLLSIALQQAKHGDTLHKKQESIQSLYQFNGYLQNRYANAIKNIQQIVQKLKTQLPQNLTSDLLQSINSFPNLLSIHTQNDSKERDYHFINWIKLAGERAQNKVGVSFEHKIDKEATRELIKATGENYPSLYWLTFEIIENIIQHSQATKMHIRLEKKDTKIQFNITDNGDGLARTSERKEIDHVGKDFKNIHSLAKLCGGHIELGKDERGFGLSITVNWLERGQNAS